MEALKQRTIPGYLNGSDEEVIKHGQNLLEDPARLVDALRGQELPLPASLDCVRAPRSSRKGPQPAAMKAPVTTKIMKVVESVEVTTVRPATMPALRPTYKKVKTVPKVEAKVDVTVMRVATRLPAMKVSKTRKRRAPGVKALRAARDSVATKAAMFVDLAMIAVKNFTVRIITKAIGRPAAAHVRRRPVAIRRLQ